MRAHWRPFVIAILTVSLAQTAAAQTGMCRQGSDAYAKDRYIVRNITIETPLGGDIPFDWIFGLESDVKDFVDKGKADLPLQEGNRFDNLAYGLSLDKLRQHFGQLRRGEKFRIVYVVPSLQACDDTNHTLDVVYHVYSTSYLSFVSRVFEFQPDKIDRSLLPGTVRQNSKILPAPLMGYNRSRGIFGGGRLSATTHFGPIEKTDVAATASASSFESSATLSGNPQFPSGLFDHAEWQFRHEYINLPSDNVRRKGGMLAAQILASTRPLGDAKVALRFGSALEGGHLQTETSEVIDLTGTVKDTAFGTLKLYSGATMRFGRQSLKASYGLQLGQAGKGIHIDYVKQIVDSAYGVRFLPRDHMPLRIDTQFSAGRIDASSRIPVGELFYGGNVQRNFMSGDSWRINSAPFIRSIPQGRFRRVGDLDTAGGTEFFSFNLTAAQAVWKHPLVPEQLIHDPELSTQLKLNLRSRLEDERGQVELSYLRDQPAFNSMKDRVANMDAKLREIRAALTASGLTGLSENAATLQSDATDNIDAALEQTKEFLESPDIDPIISLIVPFQISATEVLPSSLETCIASLTEFTNQLSDPSHATTKMQLQTNVSELDSLRKSTLDQYQTLLDLLKVKPEDLKTAQRSLDPIADSLAKMSTELDTVEMKLNETPAFSNVLNANRLAAFRDNLASAQAFLRVSKEGEVRARNPETFEARKELNMLAEGFEVAVARLGGLVKALDKLRGPLTQSGMQQNWKRLETEAGHLKKYRQEIRASLRTIHYSPPQIATAEAVDFSGHTLDTIFRELNLVAVSPVFMLDVARLGLVSDATRKTIRYGLGSGIRFTMLSIDMTAGYSWNLHRLPDEKHGAFFFSLEVNDLLR